MTISQDIILKRSATPGAEPLPGQLQYGEVALNYNDGKIHYKNTANNIVAFLDEPGVKALGDIGFTLHVSSENGDDSNNGKTWPLALKTIDYAIELANTIASDYSISHLGATIPSILIDVAPGVYETLGHLDMPDNSIVRGVYRTATIIPKNEQVLEDSGVHAGETVWCKNRNVFRMGSGCFIEGLLFDDFVLDDINDPNEGFAVSFRPGAVLFRTPYAHKIAVRNTPEWARVGIAPPLDRDATPVPNPLVGLGGGVALADGSVCSPFSIYPNLMTWGATPVVHNGVSYCAKKGGLLNAVNAISLWAHKHFYALDGGQIILSGCTCQFGDYTLVSNGFRYGVSPYTLEEISGAPNLAVIPNAGTTLSASVRAGIVNDLWNYMVAHPSEYPNLDLNSIFIQTATKKDASTLLQCITWVLQSAKEKPMLDFAKGLHSWNAEPVTQIKDEDGNITVDMTQDFINSWVYLKNAVNAIFSGNSTAQNLVSALVNALTLTIQDTTSTSPTRIINEPSIITAISHTWSVVMSGVALTKIPPASNQTTIQDSILELNDGVVYASGQDDQGSAIFVGGLKIDADTGELNGPPFDTSVNRIATRTAIARSF